MKWIALTLVALLGNTGFAQCPSQVCNVGGSSQADLQCAFSGGTGCVINGNVVTSTGSGTTFTGAVDGDTVFVGPGSFTVATNEISILNKNLHWIGNGVVTNQQTTTSYRIQDSDRSGFITFNNSSPVAVQIAPASLYNAAGCPATCAFSPTWSCDLYNVGTGTVTITPDPPTKINGATSFSLPTNTGIGIRVHSVRILGANFHTTSDWDIAGGGTYTLSSTMLSMLNPATTIIFGSSINGNDKTQIELLTVNSTNVSEWSNMEIRSTATTAQGKNDLIKIHGLAQVNPSTGLGGGFRMHNIRFTTSEVGIVNPSDAQAVSMPNTRQRLIFGSDWVTGVVDHNTIAMPLQGKFAEIANWAHASAQNSVVVLGTTNQKGVHSFADAVNWGTDYNAIVFEDNVWHQNDFTYDCCDVGGNPDGGCRYITDHNSSYGPLVNGHGTGTGGAMGLRQFELYNNFTDTQNSGSLSSWTFRGGGHFGFSNMVTESANTYPNISSLQAEKIQNLSPILGGSTGLDAFDQNHRGSLGPINGGFSWTGGVDTPDPPTDTRLGSTYYRGTGVAILTSAPKNIRLIGLDAGSTCGGSCTSKWVGFSLRFDGDGIHTPAGCGQTPNPQLPDCNAEMGAVVGYSNIPFAAVQASVNDSLGTVITPTAGGDPGSDFFTFIATQVDVINDCTVSNTATVTCGASFRSGTQFGNDLHATISGTGIPASSYIGIVNGASQGVANSIGLSSSNTSNVPVNGTCSPACTNVQVTIGGRPFSAANLKYSLRYVDLSVGSPGQGQMPLLNGGLSQNNPPIQSTGQIAWSDDGTQRYRSGITGDGYYQNNNLVRRPGDASYVAPTNSFVGSAVFHALPGGAHDNTDQPGYSFLTPDTTTLAGQNQARIGADFAPPGERALYNDPLRSSITKTSSRSYPHPLVSGTPPPAAPIISVVLVPSDYLNVVTGTNASGTAKVLNSGSATLTVTAGSFPTGYSSSQSYSFTVPAQSGSTPGEVDVPVTFSPSLVQTYAGTITFTSNATRGSGSANVTGAGVAPINPPNRVWGNQRAGKKAAIRRP